MADEKLTLETETSVASPEAQTPSAQLSDKRPRPEGVVPKQAQGYVMAGLAVLILMAVMFSKNHAKPAAKTADSSPLAVSTDMNQRKIQELEQDLSADQRQSQQQARNEAPQLLSPLPPPPIRPLASLSGLRLLRCSCRPRPSRPAIRSRMRKRRWHSGRGSPRTS